MRFCGVQLPALRLGDAVDARVRVGLLAFRVALAVVVAVDDVVGVFARAALDEAVALAEGAAVAVRHRVRRSGSTLTLEDARLVAGCR